MVLFYYCISKVHDDRKSKQNQNLLLLLLLLLQQQYTVHSALALVARKKSKVPSEVASDNTVSSSPSPNEFHVSAAAFFALC